MERRGYARRYDRINRVGHTKPAPAFGTPTLAWHIGVWPDASCDPLLARGEEGEVYEQNYGLFIELIQAFLDKLDRRGRAGCVAAEQRERFKLAPVYELEEGDYACRQNSVKRYGAIKPDTIGFTIWWQDSPEKQTAQMRPGATPGPEALRARVETQNHLDHATISIFIDAGKAWDKAPVHSAAEARELGGARRAAIFEHAEAVRGICEARSPDVLEHDLLPEREVAGTDRKLLLEAADYFYKKIWDEFRSDFGLEDLDKNFSCENGSAKVFADFRGLVMSTNGFADSNLDEDAKLALRKGAATRGAKPFDRFDPKKNEPNAVLKLYWPFIRRTTRWADDKEFIACGVMHWSALYATPLGYRQRFVAEDESSSRAGEINGWDEKNAGAARANASAECWLPETGASPPRFIEPARYLALTKGEPHRKQIGRIVERLNALGVMRLFALKDWAAIRNAGGHIRALGQELDAVLTDWFKRRNAIQDEFREVEELKQKCAAARRDLEAAAGGRSTAFVRRMREWRLRGKLIKLETELQDKEDKKTERMQEENNHAEESVIQIGARLDQLGWTATGGLRYCIARANHHVKEFERMVKRLEPQNIETWVSYDQFADRGLKPAFDLITATGERLNSLRRRLQAVTESVQTAALVIQTSATRTNTATLRKIGSDWYKLTFFSGSAIVVAMLSLFKDSLSGLLKEILTLLKLQ